MWTSDLMLHRLSCFSISPFRVPTPLAAVISGAVFALAHLTPGQFPQLFVLGIASLFLNVNDIGLQKSKSRNYKKE